MTQLTQTNGVLIAAQMKIADLQDARFFSVHICALC